MSLVEIKRYMRSVRMATLNNLCALFKAEPDTIRCMLQHFINKGNIRLCTKHSACGSNCFKCPAADVEIYEWIDKTSAWV